MELISTTKFMGESLSAINSDFPRDSKNLLVNGHILWRERERERERESCFLLNQMLSLESLEFLVYCRKVKSGKVFIIVARSTCSI